jgi:hypothetical protein
MLVKSRMAQGQLTVGLRGGPQDVGYWRRQAKEKQYDTICVAGYLQVTAVIDRRFYNAASPWCNPTLRVQPSSHTLGWISHNISCSAERFLQALIRLWLLRRRQARLQKYREVIRRAILRQAGWTSGITDVP